MSRVLIDAILRTWARQRDYAQRLVADLSSADMTSQPIPGITLNHPAWIFSHIGLYPSVLSAILRGAPFQDPITSPYGKDSRPVADPAAYAEKDALMAHYFRDHDELAQTLAATDESVLARPIPLPRWEQRFPFIADAIVHLMIDHEMGHLGQLSAWRRAGGRSSV